MRTEVKAILRRLQEVKLKVEGYLALCSYEPTQEGLEAEIEALEVAIDALENID